MHVFKDWNQIKRAVGFNFGSPADGRCQRYVAGRHIDIGFIADGFNHFHRGCDGFPWLVFRGPFEIFRPNADDHEDLKPLN